MMTQQVRSCSPADPVSRAAKIMSEVNCGAVPIVEGQKVVGILTDRDIVLRCIAGDKDSNNCKCGDVMTRGATTITPDTDAHQAAGMMAQKQIRRLPVVDNQGNICGIVALGDMATVNIHVNEAGEALSQISTPAQPGAH
jgi:CBS domain-containing protein